MMEQRKRIPRKGIGLSLAANCSEHKDPAWSRFCADEDIAIVREIYFADNFLCNYLSKGIRAPAQKELFVQVNQKYREMVLIPEAYEAKALQETQKPCMLQALTLIQDNKLFLIWEYDGTLYRTETIQALAKDHLDFIKSMVSGFLAGSS
jgi:hypothetical protein